MLQQIFQQTIGKPTLVGPGTVPKNTVEFIRIGFLDGPEGIPDCLAYVLCDFAHIVPVRVFGEDKAVSFFPAVCLRPVFLDCLFGLLLIHIVKALEEQQRKMYCL